MIALSYLAASYLLFINFQTKLFDRSLKLMIFFGQRVPTPYIRHGTIACPLKHSHGDHKTMLPKFLGSNKDKNLFSSKMATIDICLNKESFFLKK